MPTDAALSHVTVGFLMLGALFGIFRPRIGFAILFVGCLIRILAPEMQ